MLPRGGAQIVSTLAEDSWCGREGLQDLRTQSDVIFGLGLGLQACEPRKCASFHFDMVYLISPEAGTSGKHTKRRVAWTQGFAKICWTLKVLSKGGRQSLKITELLLGDRLFLQKNTQIQIYKRRFESQSRGFAKGKTRAWSFKKRRTCCSSTSL